MKKTGLILTTITLLCGIAANAAFLDNIPPATLQIARESGFNQYYSISGSKLVRVGLGNENFTSYERDEVKIYGTGEFEVYNNNTFINTYDTNYEITVKTVGNIFVITDAEGKTVAKVSGPVVFKTDFGFLGIKGLKRGGRDALYRGRLELVPSANAGKFHVVNVLGVEDYLKGVVPNEMPVRFGLEALKAQSIAARNYVLSPRVKANPNYDVVDSVASQVYYGANTEKEASTLAVTETAGLVAIYGWDLILAQYSSTAGGYTESYSNAFSDNLTKAFPSTPKPYLVAKPDYGNTPPLNTEEAASKFYKSKPDSFDVNSSYYRWEREWNGQEIQDAVQANIASQSATGFIAPAVQKGETIGIIKKLEVKKRGDSGKIIELEIQTDKGNYTVKKELVIRRLLTCNGKALPSANVVFEHEYDKNGDLIYIHAFGGGYGHGVGMSQFGAGYMGTELKKSYDEILKHYYSGIIIATEPEILSSEKSQNKVEKTFFAKYGKAILVVDNKYKVKYIDATINNVDEKIELDTEERYNKIDLSKYLQKGLNTVKFGYPEGEQPKKAIRFYMEPVEKYECDRK